MARATKATKAAPRKAAATPRRTVAQVQKELDEFKSKVLEVALREARDREWCEEFKGILRNDLGLEVPKQVIRVTFDFDLEEADYVRVDDDDRMFEDIIDYVGDNNGIFDKDWKKAISNITVEDVKE